MATGIPAVASPTGANTSIIDNGINGFICNSKEEWIRSLSMLLNDKAKEKKWAFWPETKLKCTTAFKAGKGAFYKC